MATFGSNGTGPGTPGAPRGAAGPGQAAGSLGCRAAPRHGGGRSGNRVRPGAGRRAGGSGRHRALSACSDRAGNRSRSRARGCSPRRLRGEGGRQGAAGSRVGAEALPGGGHPRRRPGAGPSAAGGDAAAPGAAGAGAELGRAPGAGPGAGPCAQPRGDGGLSKSPSAEVRGALGALQQALKHRQRGFGGQGSQGHLERGPGARFVGVLQAFSRSFIVYIVWFE